MIIDDPGQYFLYLVSILLLTGNISCLRKLITISLSPLPSLSLSFQRTRSKGPDCSDPPPPFNYLLYFCYHHSKFKGGGASPVIKSSFYETLSSRY